MENKITVITECERPRVLVVTPLLPGHKVSKQTRKSMKRCDVDFAWVTSEGIHNIPTNTTLGIDWFIDKYHYEPSFFIMIDRDITLGRYMLDRLVATLTAQPSHIAFSYANFQFKGHVNVSFPAIPYDINRLLQHNYISSNSLFRLPIVRKVGLVCDDKYKRLLDWAFLLKLFYYGYSGIPCPTASFVAHSTKNDISAGSNEDYNIKRQRVLQDFGVPLVEAFKNRASKKPNLV